jgi:hypothetical protein
MSEQLPITFSSPCSSVKIIYNYGEEPQCTKFVAEGEKIGMGRN